MTSIEAFVSKTSSGIDGIGLFLGAGASFEAGYPLVSGLTDQVVGALTVAETSDLEEVLNAGNVKYDVKDKRPNIEEIADLVVRHYIDSADSRFDNLRKTLQTKVSDCILSVASPDLSNHVKLLESLKRRAFDRPAKVWIFTTNYDHLIEQAACEAGVNVITGFTGATTRYFSESEFNLIRGLSREQRFQEESGLTVRLIKLHGSVSWFKRNGHIYESHPDAIATGTERCMVLPRRSKVVETLSAPYDRLFYLANSTIGSSCKHLIASGFGFGDDHINSLLIAPKLSSMAINLTNFCLDEPHTLADFRLQPNMTNVCSSKTISNGVESAVPSELWKFSEFSKLF